MALPIPRAAFRSAVRLPAAPCLRRRSHYHHPTSMTMSSSAPPTPSRRNISTTPPSRGDEEFEDMMLTDPDMSIPAPLPFRKPTASTKTPRPTSSFPQRPTPPPSSSSSSSASSAAMDALAAATAAPQSTAAAAATLVDRPRWSYTPERMKAPFNPNVPKDPRRSVWVVNDDPRLLDDMYFRLLGRDGAKMLQDEVKWLAVTHKSFDQGRRGFNDKLAYFGRMSILMECAQWIASSAPKKGALVQDRFGREPFQNRSLEMLDNLNVKQPVNIITREKVHRLALDVGLDKVLRWKPKTPENLEGAGLTLVLNGAMHAIIGAVWLQHGAEMGGRVVRDKILRRIVTRE